MPETAAARSVWLAGQFEVAQHDFIRLVESLSDEQWRLKGITTPVSRSTTKRRTGRWP